MSTFVAPIDLDNIDESFDLEICTTTLLECAENKSKLVSKLKLYKTQIDTLEKANDFSKNEEHSKENLEIAKEEALISKLEKKIESIKEYQTTKDEEYSEKIEEQFKKLTAKNETSYEALDVWYQGKLESLKTEYQARRLSIDSKIEKKRDTEDKKYLNYIDVLKSEKKVVSSKFDKEIDVIRAQILERTRILDIKKAGIPSRQLYIAKAKYDDIMADIERWNQYERDFDNKTYKYKKKAAILADKREMAKAIEMQRLEDIDKKTKDDEVIYGRKQREAKRLEMENEN
jgi:hypothetical protein